MENRDIIQSWLVLNGKREKIAWRHYTQQLAATVEDTNDNDTDYSPSSTSARNLVLETVKGNLIEFLDKYEETSEKHALHRNLVSTERMASIAYDQNVRPLMMTRNQDFAENGSIKNKRQVQSQYWITISYTLFISCVTWVVSVEWNKEAGKLKVGDEVTVFGEKSGEPIAMYSFWSTVTSIVDAEAEVYEVTDKNGNLHRLARKELRHRQNHNIVFGHVSDDKSHDSYAMQHFTTNELEDLERYMLENFPADIPTGKIQCLHSKSDNAALHFKSRKSMNYFSRLIKD